MKKRFLPFALAISFILALVPSAIPAAVVTEYKSTEKFLMAIAPPAEGSIPVSNRAELAAIKSNGKYHLVADIDLSDGAWVPIANLKVREGWGSGTSLLFSGVFDGQGHIIRGLTIIGEVYLAGLFGRATSDAVIKNLGLEDVNIDVKVDKYPGHNFYAGGISGYGGSIYNCYSTGSISVNLSYSVSLSGSDYAITAYVGGICGANGNISNSYNASSIFASTANASIWRDTQAISYAGGICGKNDNGLIIGDSYNTGNITANSISRDSHTSYVGGICAYSVDGASVRNSYWDIDSLQIANDTALSNTEKQGLGYGMGQATGLTSEQMKTQASFPGWDFSSVWAFKPGVNSGFPVLRAFHEFPSSWAEYSVNRAITAGVVPQSLQTKYTADITRAEFCALAVAVYERHTGGTITERATFSDTTDANVEKAAGAGIVGGGGDGKFNPGGTFNREMAAVLLVNLLKAMNTELGNNNADFSDKGSISGWALEQVGQAQAAGLVSGNGGRYDPKGKFTREAGIILMLNLWDYLV